MAMQACLFSSSMLEVTSSNDTCQSARSLGEEGSTYLSIRAYVDLIKLPSLQVYVVEIHFHTDLCN